MAKIAADIPIVSGRFQSQPLVFAHLWDMARDFDLDAVDVLQGTSIRTRLEGYFPPVIATEILTRMQTDDTLVLFLPGCAEITSDRLRPLGSFIGTLVRAP